MTTYTLEDDHWEKAQTAAENITGLRVHANDFGTSPEIQFLADGHAFYHLTGTAPQPETDTTHTVATVNPEAEVGNAAFAIHAHGNDIVFEALRSDADPFVADEPIEHVRSALNEILIPVYIDDVVSDFSEEVSPWVALHTVQYDDNDSSWSYFRTALFDNGSLQVEDEYGEI